MANDASSRLGLRPLNNYDTNKITYFRANTSQAIYLYQPVAINNSGELAVAALADLTKICGSAIGFLDLNKAALPSGVLTTSAAPYLPASTDAYVGVLLDANQLYTLEEDTGGSALTQSNIGNSCTFTYLATTGNTTTGIANVVLDRSDAAADTGGMFQLVGITDDVNSDGTPNTFGNNVKWIIKIQHAQFTTQVNVPV